MPENPTDFSFLSADVRRQREIAREALDEAKKIDELLKKPTAIDDSSKASLEDAKKALLKIASELAHNAVATTTHATATFSGAGRLTTTIE